MADYFFIAPRMSFQKRAWKSFLNMIRDTD
jgi:hypothetical protein